LGAMSLMKAKSLRSQLGSTLSILYKEKGDIIL
jgi:hypothetical protein